MFTTARLLVASLAVTVLAACSSAPPKPVVDFAPDHDFSADKKIALYAGSGQVSGDNPMQMTGFQKDRVDQALTQVLTERGFTIVDNAADADLLISWHLNTQEKTDIRTTNTGPSMGMSVGYSRYNRYAMYSCYSCFDTHDVSVKNYTQGTFIVDMIDPEEKQSVWRSVTQSKLKGEAVKDPATLKAAASLVLQNFPPAK